MVPISLWWKKEGYINIFSSSAMMLVKKVGKRKKSRNRKWQSRWRTISLWQGIVLMCRDDAATICQVIWYFFTVFYKIRDIQLYRPCSEALRATSQFGPTLSPMNLQNSEQRGEYWFWPSGMMLIKMEGKKGKMNKRKWLSIWCTSSSRQGVVLMCFEETADRWPSEMLLRCSR